jgi:hypothetical protein
MSTKRVLQVTHHYRSRLKQHEAAAHHALTQAHTQMVTAIQPHLNALYRQIDDKQKEGEAVTIAWLYVGHRLTTIKKIIAQHGEQYGQLTKAIAGQAQHQMVTLGAQAAQDQFQASVTADNKHPFKDASPHTIAQLTDVTQADSPRAQSFHGYGQEAAQKVASVIIGGVSIGHTVKQIASGVLDGLKIMLYRALTSVSSAIQDAFRGATQVTYQANSDVVVGWVWICSFSNSCAACISLHGSEHTLDEELDDHLNGSCSQAPIMSSGAIGMDGEGLDVPSGSEWFDNQDEALQLDTLGPGKYAAWKNGDFTLDDTVGVDDDPIYGRSVYEKPLKVLIK